MKQKTNKQSKQSKTNAPGRQIIRAILGDVEKIALNQLKRGQTLHNPFLHVRMALLILEDELACRDSRRKS